MLLVKLQQITQPGIAICQKLADLEIIRVYERIKKYPELFDSTPSRINTYILDDYDDYICLKNEFLVRNLIRRSLTLVFNIILDDHKQLLIEISDPSYFLMSNIFFQKSRISLHLNWDTSCPTFITT